MMCVRKLVLYITAVDEKAFITVYQAKSRVCLAIASVVLCGGCWDLCFVN